LSRLEFTIQIAYDSLWQLYRLKIIDDIQVSSQIHLSLNDIVIITILMVKWFLYLTINIAIFNVWYKRRVMYKSISITHSLLKNIFYVKT
jgi:hypothetical protein